MLNYRPSVNLRNQWLQQDHRNFTIGAEKGMSMLQCPVLHPLKIMDPSSCFHSSMNFIWHGHRQKPDQTPQNISKWRSMFFSEKSNQIWAKCLAALTQLAFTHHLFLAAHKCGWKQSCTNSKLYKKKKRFPYRWPWPYIHYIWFYYVPDICFQWTAWYNTAQSEDRAEAWWRSSCRAAEAVLLSQHV